MYNDYFFTEQICDGCWQQSSSHADVRLAVEVKSLFSNSYSPSFKSDRTLFLISPSFSKTTKEQFPPKWSTHPHSSGKSGEMSTFLAHFWPTAMDLFWNIHTAHLIQFSGRYQAAESGSVESGHIVDRVDLSRTLSVLRLARLGGCR